LKTHVQNGSNYRIWMDQRWALEDLYSFPRSYGLVYDFAYCFDARREVRSVARIDRALEDYPWQGGYSYVNLWVVLHHQVPVGHRPAVAEIRYASPGWMDLILHPAIATQIALSVAAVLSAGEYAVNAIKRI